MTSPVLAEVTRNLVTAAAKAGSPHFVQPSIVGIDLMPRELTVAAWIRHQRLECCRADLTDPRLRGMPVQAIGARWGFRSPADFSRAFRAAHGIPPGDYRRQTLAADRTADAE
jgi:AraC-like DNA-binding protein